jgi:hypothetical protein
MSEHTSETVERGGFDRREALKKAAVAGGIVWAVPVIMSSPARAQAPPCTPKCAPDTTAFSFAGTTVRKLGCTDPNAPNGQEQYIIEASVVVTATATCPCSGTAPTFSGTFVFQFTSPNPGRTAFTGTGGQITVTCTDIDGSVISRTCQFSVAVVITGNCQPQTGIQRFVNAALTGCGTPVCVTP